MINKDGTYRWSSNNAKGNFGKISKIIDFYTKHPDKGMITE